MSALAGIEPRVSAPTEPAAALPGGTPVESPELGDALRTLAGISEDLLGSYAALAARAERMDRELADKNAELVRKVAELDSLRAHLEAVLRALPTGVVVRDASGRIVRANPAAAAILGTSEEDLAGSDGHPELLGREALGEPREILLPDGERRTIEQRWSEIGAGRGGIAGSVEILDDRTEIARLNERLHSLDKLAALGTMASGIAHEIRNPLNAVRGFAELLRREFAEDERRARWAARICEGVDEADLIIANMLSFGAPEKLRRENLEPGELVASAIELALRSLPRDLEPSRWKVTSTVACPGLRADRIKLRQALRNLVANALEVQPRGGSVHVSCELRGDEVVFDVYDAGPGIPAALRTRVVDPFFTTRPEGTGLGLALVHTIAELHGGRFRVSPTPAPRQHGGGAHMVLSVPYQEAK